MTIAPIARAIYRPLSDGGKKEGEYIFRKRSEL